MPRSHTYEREQPVHCATSHPAIAWPYDGGIGRRRLRERIAAD